MTHLELFHQIVLAPFIDPKAMRKAEAQPWRHVLGMRAEYSEKLVAFFRALDKAELGPLDPIDPCDACGGHGLHEEMCYWTMRKCNCCRKCANTCKERNDIVCITSTWGE